MHRTHGRQEGSNPLSGWKPSVPEGQRLELGSEHYDALEREGLDEVRRRSGLMQTWLLRNGLPPCDACSVCYPRYKHKLDEP